MAYFVFFLRRVHLPILFVLLLAYIPSRHAQPLETITTADFTCSQSLNNLRKTEFLCGTLINVTRLPDCSLLVTEKLIFPHSIEATFERYIPKLRGLQEVTKASVTLDGKNVKTRLYNVDLNGMAVISFDTAKRAGTAIYTVSYAMSNGALQFSKTCRGTASQSFPRDNVIRWRSGNIGVFTIELTSVQFFSIKNAKLSFQGVPLNFTKQQNGTIARTNQFTVIEHYEIYVREENTPLCPQKLVCQDVLFTPWALFFLIAGSILGFVVIVVVLLLIRKMVSRSRTAEPS